MIKRIIKRYFYNPYNVVKNNKNINLGKGTILLKSTTFRINQGNNINIGKDCMLACSFIFESNYGDINIGDRSFINGSTNLISRTKIEIGNDVVIAWGCNIYDHNSHSLDWRERVKDVKQQIDDYNNGRDFIANKNWQVVKSNSIIIKDKVWIGFDVTILNGVTIGEGAIIGAKSVVREDVPPWTIVVGNPAVIVKKIRK